MTREDLYGHYRRYYVPNNATLVIVGDVDTDDVLRRVEGQFGGIPPGRGPRACGAREPAQQAERRVLLRKEGTTAYWKAAYHAPAFADADFFPMLVVDAVLSGAAGLNLWSMRQGAAAAAQRAPVPRAGRRGPGLVCGRGVAADGAAVPVHGVGASGPKAQTLAAVEDAVLAELDRLCRDGITPAELAKARTQLRARLVFDADSVTDIAHQLGYFETIASWRAYHELRAASRR